MPFCAGRSKWHRFGHVYCLTRKLSMHSHVFVRMSARQDLVARNIDLVAQFKSAAHGSPAPDHVGSTDFMLSPVAETEESMRVQKKRPAVTMPAVGAPDPSGTEEDAASSPNLALDSPQARFVHRATTRIGALSLDGMPATKLQPSIDLEDDM